MDGIKKLIEVGIKEIEDQTHIESHYIEAIIEKNVEVLSKINRTKLNGFLTILEREYGIDLEEVRGEYFHESESISKTEDKDIFPLANSEDKSGKKILFFIILISIVAYSYYYINSKNNSEILEVVKETEIIKANDSVNNEVVVEEPIKDLNITKEEEKVEVVANDTNSSETKVEESEKIETTENIDNNESNTSSTITAVSIVPKNKIWVGILYLDTMKKVSTVDRNITLDLTRDQLVVTGHGIFKLYVNGEVKVYKQSKKVRLLYKDSNLSEVSKDEYRLIGEGKAW